MFGLVFFPAASLFGFVFLVLGMLDATGVIFADRGTTWATWALIVVSIVLFIVAGILSVREVRSHKVS